MEEESGLNEEEVEQQSEAKSEVQRASVHIMLDTELLESVRKMADYAAAVGLIHDDPRGNVTDFLNWCIMIGKEQLRLYVLKKRKFI